MSSEQASPHIKGYRGVDAMTALGGKTNEQCQQASGVEEIVSLLMPYRPSQATSVFDRAIATVRQLAGEKKYLCVRNTALSRDLDAAREELRESEREAWREMRAAKDAWIATVKENDELRKQLATLKAAGDAELEGLLDALMRPIFSGMDPLEKSRHAGTCIPALEAIRTHVAGLRQRIKELSLFTPVPDEELERAMASYGRTIEAVVIRKAVRALEQRIKELEDQLHGSTREVS